MGEMNVIMASAVSSDIPLQMPPRRRTDAIKSYFRKLFLQIYKNFSDRVNVKIGERHGSENFFKINTWNHRSTVPRFYPESGDCNAKLDGSSEGALYPQLITNETVLWYWRKTLCRSVPLYFDSEVQWGNLKGYKFILRDDVYDRFENQTADCYKGSDLADGLSDVSKCFFGACMTDGDFFFALKASITLNCFLPSSP